MFKIKGSPILSLFKGLLIGYIITIIVLFVLSALVTYTDFNENYIVTIIRVVTVIVCILCGLVTAKSAKKGGIWWGILSGFTYVLVMGLIGFILIPNYEIGPNLLINLALAIAGGGVGGVLGVNI